jgi:hypothetical protein
VLDSEVSVQADKGRVRVSIAKGKALDGEVLANATLTKEAAGASLTVSGSWSGVTLSRLGGGNEGLPMPSGLASLAFELSGKGLSPRSLVGLASGKGTLAIGDGEIAGISPLTTDAAARAVLSDASPVNGDVLTRAMAKSRFTSPFPMPATQTQLTIADGLVRIGDIHVDSQQAELMVTPSIDLLALKTDSRWTLTPRAPSPDARPLPVTELRFLNSLVDTAKTEPTLIASDLEHELATRKALGGPEQMTGLWPIPEFAAGVSSEAAPTETAKPKLGANAVAPAAMPAVIPSPPPSPTAPTSPAGAAQATPQASSSNQPAMVQAAPPQRVRHKQPGWGTMGDVFQNLFGN